jgi:hypothetical protein
MCVIWLTHMTPSAMRQNLTLTMFGLLTVVLSLTHITQDTMFDKAGVDRTGVTIILAIMIVFLYGIIELAGRRSGYVITLLGGLGAAYMPYLHSMGPIGTAKGFDFIWVNFALGVTGAFSALLAAKALWRSVRSAEGVR